MGYLHFQINLQHALDFFKITILLGTGKQVYSYITGKNINGYNYAIMIFVNIKSP